MPRLQHFVIYCDDPRKSAKFYEKLGLTKVVDGEELDGPVICFSDGYVNFALLPTGGEGSRREGRTPGFNHIGFIVDDVEGTARALEETGANIFKQDVPKEVRESLAGLPPSRAQITYVDPEGVPVELATKRWPA